MAQDVLKIDSEGTLISVNLDLKNPRAKENVAHLPPEQLVGSIIEGERNIAKILEDIKALLEKQPHD